ncbi:hypothetical protein NBRC116598_00250 [Pseudophaeobacter arcticus]|uniref:Uncharacterized protein n=1 Tax=Pseudophaeobacter arcticus TaxID=385492 RepID=A0ABQ0AFD5_9RHOB
MSTQYSDRLSARLKPLGLISNEVGAVFGMKGGMHHLADHKRRAELTGSASETGAAFGWGQAVASALKRHVQQATVLELAKHCRDLLAAHLSQVSADLVNILVWRKNGDVAYA